MKPVLLAIFLMASGMVYAMPIRSCSATIQVTGNIAMVPGAGILLTGQPAARPGATADMGESNSSLSRRTFMPNSAWLFRMAKFSLVANLMLAAALLWVWRLYRLQKNRGTKPRYVGEEEAHPVADLSRKFPSHEPVASGQAGETIAEALRSGASVQWNLQRPGEFSAVSESESFLSTEMAPEIPSGEPEPGTGALDDSAGQGETTLASENNSPRISYLSFPSGEANFSFGEASERPTPGTIFRIELDDSGRGKLFLEESSIMLRRGLQNPDLYFRPVCDFLNLPDEGFSTARTIEPGDVQLHEETLVVSKKLRIKFQ